MSIKHCDLLSWVHERNGRLKYKNHAQDCETLTLRQHPAILPWFLYSGWHPSFRVVRAPCPLCPAAGLLLDVLFEHDLFENMLWLAHDRLSKIESPALRKIMRKRAQTA